MNALEPVVAEDAAALREALGAVTVAGCGIALVPTMGALHDGHLALVRRAAELGRPLVVSIFVNPMQFGPDEDFERYPRTFEADRGACREHGVDVIFAPAIEDVYPEDVDLRTPPLPPVATEPGLEDACRPGHFEGVVLVVARLFDLVRPAVAVFGEKDYQQLAVIRAMVAGAAASEPDRWGPLRIEGHPTVRDPDGLAMSSRNAYLGPEERQAALGLSRALQAAAGANHPPTAEQLMAQTLIAHDLRVEYAVVRDAETLRPVGDFSRPTRALIAACCGTTRLIDNRAMPVWS
ncbi:MAG: pantoate--beta-alanine ligase [Planctomycetota bacterium]|jgi:pantoate--beta-alanine ligase